MVHDWPVLFVGFPMLMICTPAAAILGRHLGKKIEQTDD